MRFFLKSIITIIFVLTFLPTTVFADNNTITMDEHNDAWLQISPVSKRLLLIKPGEVIEETLKVINTGDREMTIEVYTTPYFISSNAPGLSFESENRYTQISRWTQFLSESGKYIDRLTFNIGPEESKDIKYKISVPKDAASGGQYASIFAEVVPGEAQGITTTTRVGMTIYASIDGEDPRIGSVITNVKSQHLSIDGKINVTADIDNTGNIDFQSSAELKLSTIFGEELRNNTTVLTVFPESVNTISATLDSSAIGLFRLSYKIKATEDVIIEGSHLVLVASPFVVGLGIALFILMIITIIYLIKRSKQRKSELLSQC